MKSGGDFPDTHPAKRPGSVAQFVRGRSGSRIKDLIRVFGTGGWTPAWHKELCQKLPLFETGYLRPTGTTLIEFCGLPSITRSV
jgi:hypothetical protein